MENKKQMNERYRNRAALVDSSPVRLMIIILFYFGLWFSTNVEMSGRQLLIFTLICFIDKFFYFSKDFGGNN